MSSMGSCPKCNAPWGRVECPDRIKGCYVAHYGCTAICIPVEPTPLRTEITVLGPDNPKTTKSIAFAERESLGIGIRGKS